MSRFSLDSSDLPELLSPLTSKQSPSSVRLSCTDGTALFSLEQQQQQQSYIIQAHRLPLYEDAIDEEAPPPRVTTTLPRTVQELLKIDAPLEITSLPCDAQEQALLCVYTRSAVFMIRVDHNRDGPALNVEEPLAGYLNDHAYATKIIRVRSSPLASPGGLAMLVYNSDYQQHTLVLYHAATQTCTVALEWRSEDVVEADAVVDFCFGQSSHLSLFSSLSIVVLKESGDLYTASPILFYRSAVPRQHVQEALSYLQARLEDDSITLAQRRLYRAAQVYVADTFPTATKRPFCTSRHDKESADWPTMLQGPILVDEAENDDESPVAHSVESFGHVALTGVAVSRGNHTVDFCLLSPTSLVPRFGFESIEDGYELNDALLGVSVERVRLGGTSGEPSALVRDVLVDSMLHYVTPSVVCTLQTDVLRNKCRELQGFTTVGSSLTTAWAVVSSPKEAIQGCVPSGDLSVGHSLIVTLKNGITSSLSVNETRYLGDLGSIQPNAGLIENDSSSRIDGEPFHQVVAPTIDKIRAGLRNMAKLVGSDTRASDITPDQLAAVLQIRDDCDRDIVIPLLELKKFLEVEKKRLQETIAGQQKQVESIQAMMRDVQGRTTKLTEKMEVLRSNNTALNEKSVALHIECQQLLPKISHAEAEYASFIQRVDARLPDMVEQAQDAETKVRQAASDSAEKDTSETASKLKKHDAHVQGLLNSIALELQRAEHALKTIDQRSKDTLRSSGMEPENIPSNLP